ncbi:MAG: RNA polymerase sigma-70 factor, partial [Actinobacteria bacterium]|nr:RNA polymerase sigma-70 factor [Actinomycetota bacterium]MBU2111207.1 RNA polymerase sigma-70 factor [Actinomycetota bacterium]
AARRPVLGPDRVARFLVGVTARRSGDTFLPALVNGRLGLVALAPAEDGSGARRRLVVSLTVDGGLVSRVDLVMAPDKLGG